ncbi:hypothetical protein FKM82_025307 [Ascaphus truei]
MTSKVMVSEWKSLVTILRGVVCKEKIAGCKGRPSMASRPTGRSLSTNGILFLIANFWSTKFPPDSESRKARVCTVKVSPDREIGR